MKNKSVPAFVLGLIGFLIDLGVVFYTYVILALVLALIAANGGSALFYPLMIIQFVRLIVCIVAFVFSFKNSKVAGILYSIAFLTSIVVPITIGCLNGVSATLFVFFIPSLFYLLSAILAFVANAKFKKANEETKKETELSL